MFFDLQLYTMEKAWNFLSLLNYLKINANITRLWQQILHSRDSMWLSWPGECNQFPINSG